MDRLRPLTPAAWIAVVGAVAGAVAYAWFVSQIPFSTVDAGQAAGTAFGVAITAAMFFAPQVVVVFLFATESRFARGVGIALGGFAAIGGIAILALWATGAQLEGSQSYDVKALGLWLPLIVMGIIDGIAAAVAFVALRREQTPTVQHPSAA